MRLFGIFLSIILVFTNFAYASHPQQETKIPRLKSLRSLKAQGIERQTLDYSCGAASLNILLHSYFNDYTFNESALLKDIILRLDEKELKLRITDGFSMLDLKQLALRLGYVADGILLPKEAIYKLKGPVIILLHKNDIKHFVILKGAREGRAFIADPIAGNYRVPAHELFSQWKGETLIIGREGFGLPQEHGLAIPPANQIAAEGDVVRSLKHTRFMRNQSP